MLCVGKVVGIDPASNSIGAFKNLIRKVGYVESIQNHGNVQTLTVSAMEIFFSLINLYRLSQPRRYKPSSLEVIE